MGLFHRNVVDVAFIGKLLNRFNFIRQRPILRIFGFVRLHEIVKRLEIQRNALARVILIVMSLDETGVGYPFQNQ